ncbi:hypothetical protein [Erwinia sp. 9145]|uniref:hypothetical protein n=1 Tax=Erwinia sp. 9145 TaxID=1500895 RepID=UPI000552E1CE|nr:hypothetical protein [Erwinia sp. 9145]
MTAEVIPFKKTCPHLENVHAGMTLLKKFNNEGGHSQQTTAMILEQIEIDLALHQAENERR